MNMIKKVVVFVMGVIVIGIVATSIGVVTQPKNSVSFEILENGTYSPNVFDKVSLYSVVDVDDKVTNIQSLKVNDVDVTSGSNIHLYTVDFSIYLPSKDGSDYFNEDGTYVIEDGLFQVGDVITITFELGNEMPTIIKTLLFLAPLILSASLIGFLVFKKGDE